MDAVARIEGLEAENGRLRDRIAQLEEAMGLDFIAPLEWRLTRAETALFGVLLAREIATKEALLTGIVRDPTGEAPEIKIVDVFVCKARRKLRPFGIEIETLWGRGYRLSPEVKALARAQLAEAFA